MTHDQLCDRARRWLKSAFGCGVVVTEFRCSSPEEPDALGFRYGGVWSILVECKTSRADFLADQKKPHRQIGGMGQERWYLTPPELLDPLGIPDGWGLAEVRGKTVPGGSHLSKGPRGVVNPDVCRADMPVLYSIAHRLLDQHGLVSLSKALGGVESDS